MSHEAVAATGFPEVVELDRDDIYLQLAGPNDGQRIYRLITDNPYIAHYHYWARDLTPESSEVHVARRMRLMARNEWVQYLMVAPDDPDYEAYDGMAGAVTAHSRDVIRSSAKFGFYQAELSQGKGRIHDSVLCLMSLAREAWGIKTAEFAVEADNTPSERVAAGLGAVRTDEAVYYELPDVPNWIWRLEL